MHAFNPRLWKHRQAHLYVFVVIVLYIVRSKPYRLHDEVLSHNQIKQEMECILTRKVGLGLWRAGLKR